MTSNMETPDHQLEEQSNLNVETANNNKSKIQSYVKRRLPILTWLPGYHVSWLFQDVLAGITVGLTAVPQGIAYGVVAGLKPSYGLYSSFMSSFIYIFFGSCKNITIGPTAIMSLMVEPLVSKYGPEMAVLICFLKGCIIGLFGIFHLGFLLDFISLPVITGFTTAASINIATSQLKSLLGISGKSEDLVGTFKSIFKNIENINKWDVLLGTFTIINIPNKINGTVLQKAGWILTLARNSLVVIFGILLAYILNINGLKPFTLTASSMDEGLPHISFPPFSMNDSKNQSITYGFTDMIQNMGITLFTIPVISTIEHMAIAKAFASGKSLDATQEMLALGICNVFGSFVSSMPVTGSFTRTAVNHSSGVRTPLGGIFTGGLVLLAAGFLTQTFQFIPKATLAGLIISAMYYMLDFQIFKLFWTAKKIDFFIMLMTLVTCIFAGLEKGIVFGIIMNLIILLSFTVKPSIKISIEKINEKTVVYVTPEETVTYPAAEKLRANIMKLSEDSTGNVILDCKNLKRIDVTVVKNMNLLANDLKLRNLQFIFINSKNNVTHVFNTIAPEIKSSFNQQINF
ncbi:sodium-independent sulfate anion transporter-like isoform X2 [Aphidius gifuensis]|uniref:sodium-independent sulfate anion transporter-like isoform X2 n=1 Tax=Aphidius gifuensis TaxID=684658 RepID=UPI001CDD78EE|nr:sodium-independent sulfate anion transporter-like isoform X2 [Aphidius gifuensis]